MRFVLPLPPNILNNQRHWRWKHAAKKKFYTDCDRLQLLHTIPGPPERPMHRAKGHVTLFVHQRMDEDNMVGRTKWCRDWLVTRGYIVDDHPDNLTLTVSQEVDRKHKRVEITLEAA